LVAREKLDDALIVRYTYARDDNGRFTQIVENRSNTTGSAELEAVTTHAFGDG